MTMKRLERLLLAGLLWLMLPVLVSAQSPAPASAPDKPAAGVEQPVTPEQGRELLKTLEDPKARDALIAQLKTLVAANETRKPDPAPPAATGVGSRMLAGLVDQLGEIGSELSRIGELSGSLPNAMSWLHHQLEDEGLRARWLAGGRQLALVIAAALVAAGLLGVAVRPLRRMMSAAPNASFARRTVSFVTDVALDLLVVAAFAFAGYACLVSIGTDRETRLLAVTFLNAGIAVKLILVASAAVLGPDPSRRHLVGRSDLTAVWFHRQIRNFAIVGVFGYLFMEAFAVLGLPTRPYVGLLLLLQVVLCVMLVMVILRSRVAVARWIAREAASPHDAEGASAHNAKGEGVPPAESPIPQRILRAVAGIWHIVAIVWILALCTVWAIEGQATFLFLLRATLETIAILIVARAAQGMLRRFQARRRLLPRLIGARYGHLEARLDEQRHLVGWIAGGAIWLLAALLILSAWNANLVAWIETPAGRSVTSSAFSILVVLAIAALVWKLGTAVIGALLAAQTRGARHGARIRTLAPLLRRILSIVLLTFVILVVLSELGVDIAPLLAGAGVIGLAVGFGSQTLVKDVITGMFFLFEDAISVGETIDVGNGHVGVVEAISIRSVRLRDEAGSIHTVPFSTVTAIKNIVRPPPSASANLDLPAAEPSAA